MEWMCLWMCELLAVALRLGQCGMWRERESATAVRKRSDKSCYMT